MDLNISSFHSDERIARYLGLDTRKFLAMPAARAITRCVIKNEVRYANQERMLRTLITFLSSRYRSYYLSVLP